MEATFRYMKKYGVVILLFVVTFSMAQNNQLFEQGKERYKNGKYQEAITSWMQILDNGKHSASVYFNLGNAHYKLNHVGPSIYYYEKALQLAPNDKDIKTNLAFAENARIDAIEPLPKTVFSKWYTNVSSILTFDGWAITSVVLVMLFVLLFLLYYFSFSERRKRLLFAGSLFSVLLFLVALTMTYQTYADFKNNNPAIVFSEKTEAKSGPSLGSDNVFLVHEGTKVQITATDANWVRVVLANGKEGWLPATDLKRL